MEWNGRRYNYLCVAKKILYKNYKQIVICIYCENIIEIEHLNI